ncbi:MATE family efflux transporter [uncultured Intestinimonas sp.]|uniref:MATE family efflux transporter n=1 Tax=uncultured Intestinimonas sp. TaxID=1689265 RepID=UPI0025E38293|nr:MATE family efflux transporter [uncultured Intestinimonas sp.]
MSIFRQTGDRFTQMTQTPVPQLVSTLAVPTIISMLVTSLYNMADTFFVGQIGTSATAAVGVALPLMSIIQAIGFTFGQGSGNHISRLLGQQQREEAERLCSVAFFSSFALGVLLCVFGLLSLDSMVYALGATATSAGHTRAYVFYILIGSPFMIGALVLNNQFRFQGSAVFGMIGIFSGAALNVILDPVFIFGFGMGTGGAALATIISQFFSFCLLVWGTFQKDNLRLSLRAFQPSARRYAKIFAGGLPSFWRQALASIASVLLNVAGRSFGGDVVVAAMSIVSRLTMFASSALIGLGQGYQPVCGFNYGAGLYRRVREAYWFFFRVALAASLVIALLGCLFAPQLVAIFRRDDPEVIRIGALALRMQCVSFPLMSWFFPSSMTLQTIGQSAKASVLAMCRQGLFFLPLILVLPNLLGVLGIQLSQPLSDLCSFAVALPMGIGVLRTLRAAEKAEAAAVPAGE